MENFTVSDEIAAAMKASKFIKLSDPTEEDGITKTQAEIDAELEETNKNKTQEELDAEQANEDANNELITKAEKLGGSSFNDDGDLLDDKGTILKKKDELENEELSPLETLIKDYGFEDDDDFADLDLKDDSVEGIKKFYEKRDIKIKDQAINEALGADEDVADLLQWKASGKSVNSWRAKREAETFNLEIKDDDFEGAEKLIRQNYEFKGIKGKKQDTLIQDSKDEGTLVTEAKEIATEIKDNMEKNAKALAKQEEVANIAAEKEYKETLKTIDSTIKKGSLDGRIVIPETERKSFHQFLLSDERDKMWNKLSLEQQMTLDYIVFKGLNLKGLEKPVSKTTVVRNSKMAKVNGSNDEVGDLSYSQAIEKLKNRKNT